MREREWANAERAVVSWLTARTGRPVFTETPSTLADYLPAYQVTRVGGGDESNPSKRVEVELDSIAGGTNARGGAWDAATAAQSAMWALRANGMPGWYVDEVTETFGPALEPSDNTTLRRTTATYALVMRPIR